MELTELKRVQNTKELPGYSLGAEAGDAGGSDKPNFFQKIGQAFTKEGAIGKAFSKGGFLGEGGFMDKNGSAIATGATGVLDMVNGIGAASKYNKTADDLLQDAGKSQSNIGGVGYTVQNDINKSAEEAQVDAEAKSSTLGLTAKGAATGAAIASVIPGVGTAVGGIVGGVAGFIGGLFGGGAKKREMKKQLRLAEIKRINTNDFNRSGALTTVLQNDLAETEGDQTQQTLYSAANGKESYSAGGPTSGYNARVSNGEIIANKFTGEMFRVPGIPNNKDGKLAFIRPSDTIISNKYGLSDYVAQTGDLEGGEAMQGTIMKALGKRGYKNGKLPGYKLGLEEINAIGNLGLGALSMLDSYKANNEEVYNPHSYLRNEWEAPALNALRNLRVNTYPIMGQIYDNTAKGVYAINNAGGTSGGQRAVSRLQQYEDAARTIANMQMAAQDQNNKYTQRWAEVASQLGAQNAELGVKTRWHDDEVYAQGHGRRDLKADKRRADALTFLQSYLKGVNDIHMYRGMMKHYQEEDDIKREDMRRKYGLNPNGTSATPDYTHYDNKSKYDATNIGETSYQYNPSVVPSSENIGQWIQSLINPQVQNKPKVEKKERLQTSSNGGSQYMFNPMIHSYDSADSSKNTGKTQTNNTNSTYVSPYATVQNPYSKFTYDQFMKSNSIAAKNLRKKWKGDNQNAYYNFLAMANNQLYHVK